MECRTRKFFLACRNRRGDSRRAAFKLFAPKRLSQTPGPFRRPAGAEFGAGRLHEIVSDFLTFVSIPPKKTPDREDSREYREWREKFDEFLPFLRRELIQRNDAGTSDEERAVSLKKLARLAEKKRSPRSQKSPKRQNATRTGDWNVAANWNPTQVPGTGDSAYINNGGKAQITGMDAGTIASLYVGRTANNSGTLEITSSGRLRTSGEVVIGQDAGSATGEVPSIGKVTVDGTNSTLTVRGRTLRKPAATWRRLKGRRHVCRFTPLPIGNQSG